MDLKDNKNVYINLSQYDSLSMKS